MSTQTDVFEAELAALTDPFEEARHAIALLDRHGVAAVPAVVGRYSITGEVWAPADVPADSPWRIERCGSVAEVIRQLWGALPADAAPFVQALVDSCRHVFVHRQPWGEWNLLYILVHEHPQALARSTPDAHGARSTWYGGAPVAEPALPESIAEKGWTMPSDLAVFYGIHDGLGIGSTPGGGDSIVPSGSLDFLNNDPDRLELMWDGAGHRRLFVRSEGRATLLWDWDRDTWELSMPRTFAQFLAGEFAARALGIDPFAVDWPMPTTPVVAGA